MQRDVICQGKPAVLTWVKSSPFGEEEVRIEWHDGTKRDDLLTKPQGVSDEEWFKSLVPDEFPAFTACDGKTEKRMIVRMRELEERVAKLEAWITKPADIPIPAFLQDTPPHEIADTLEEYGLKSADSYERVNETLVQALAKAKGSAELARGYGGAFDGKSVVEWERKAQSINESIRWNSGRKVETI